MSERISARVNSLREWMRRQTPQIDAYVIPTADAHGSEYIAAHWQSREWLTGFTGSAGLAVVTLTEAALWTDSRYWLQAEEELRDTPFRLMRDGDAGVPSPVEWLCEQVSERPYRVAAPADVLSQADAEELRQSGLELCLTLPDAFDAIWEDRPALPAETIDIQLLQWAGVSVKDKLAQAATLLREKVGTEKDYLIHDLSDIAWLLNLRGRDIPYNPVFVAFLLFLNRDNRFVLFTHGETLTEAAREQLQEAGVEVKPYVSASQNVHVSTTVFSPSATFAFDLTRAAGFVASPFERLRAVKNDAERDGFREAMLRDGVALVRFLREWENRRAAGEALSEMDADRILTACRAAQPGFEQLSFPTIAGYGPHGAIVHYEAEPATAATVEARSLLLLDSGAQFDCGTTDITRTLSCGELTREEREVYTLVLKGHLALAALSFPEGTCGLQLDLAARSPLWKAGLDFGHGTGHGVGSHLCVHEGPHQIRKNPRACTQVPFVEGMTITDEPGVYVAGKFGVRIENILLTVFDRETEFGRFLRFETLTLCPYDLSALAPDLLTAEEVAQLNAYHARVRSLLLPRLTDEADRDWLVRATQPLVP